MTAPLDLDFVRAQFPALDQPIALLDNAGGSAPARQVIARVTEHMERRPVQLGASYALSREASAAVDAGRRAAEALVGAREGEVVLGQSTTTNIAMIASALAGGWGPGDAVVVSDLEHESNRGPWRRLAARGVEVREWRMRTETAQLHPGDLEPLLDDRVRLVAFTHCSNVVGAVHDVARVCARVRKAGALSMVDGVAFAPHRLVDVEALGCDFYALSLYKTFGPHLGLLFGRAEVLRRARGQNHFFIGEDEVPYKLEPGNVPYELCASLVGIVDYFEALDLRHGGPASATARERVVAAYRLIADAEEQLVDPLLRFLRDDSRVHLLGPPEGGARVPTVAFHLADGRPAGT
ncbi:MAG: aminotransferase class V-fold PLP-dependent enzyme, partial [Planctomycetes bacterium]|nr:aminotransferase class V-fold PLP-dependent enzyme [Planctomycetota bacterium]